VDRKGSDKTITVTIGQRPTTTSTTTQ